MNPDIERTALVVAQAEDGVAVVQLNRPDRLNAVDLGLRRELAETFGALAQDKGVRAVVLAGRGPSFCVGGDVTELAQTRTLAEDRERILDGNRMIRSICGLEVPVVAAVHGSVVGAGIAPSRLGCDCCITRLSVSLCIPESRPWTGCRLQLPASAADRPGVFSFAFSPSRFDRGGRGARVWDGRCARSA